jgi:hypothetical protein
MGSLARGLFGGGSGQSTSQGTQTSYNKSYDLLSGALSGTLNQVGAASNRLADLLGLGDADAGARAFDQYKNSTGYQAAIKAGSDAIAGNMAAKGLLNSGATLKALNKFGQDYATSRFDSYAGQLQNLLGSGLQAGQTISGAGNYSYGTQSSKSTESKSNMGFAPILGTLLGK